MNKKSLTKNKKKTFKTVVHKFGGDAPTTAWGRAQANAMENVKKDPAGAVGSVVSGITGILGPALKNAEVDTSKADNAIAAVDVYQPATTSLDALADSYNNLEFAKSDWEGNDFTVSTGEGLANMGSAMLAGAGTGATFGPWGAVAGAAAGLAASGASWAAGAAKAKSQADELNRKAEMAGYSATQKAITARDQIQQNTVNTFLQGVKAYGGDLNLSGDFTNGLIFINEGGTHEENPNEGVLMGIDEQGIPNLVEEGEIIWNDYVFSNRLKPTKKQLKDGGFKENLEGLTYAELVNKYQEESEDSFDLISMNTLNDNLSRLMNMQEMTRAKKGLTGQNRLMACGGRKYRGDVDFSEWTDADQKWLDEQTQKTIKKVSKQYMPSTPINWNTIGRLAPTFLNAGMAIAAAAKKPDYSRADELVKEARNIPIAEAPVIGGKQTFVPTDKNPIINKQIGLSRATARDIQNNAVSGAQVMANLANLNYNTQNAIGDTMLKLAEADNARKLQIADFNRGIDQANAVANMQAQQMNQARQERIANTIGVANQMKDAIDVQKVDALESGLTNATEDTANLFAEKDWREIIEGNPYFLYDTRGKYKTPNSQKNGGCLTRKKRRK